MKEIVTDAEPRKAVLTLKHVSKRFDKASIYAVHDFSLQLYQGEILALLGESGCGKTTVLRMIAGFEHPSRGQILLKGVTMAGSDVFIEARRRGVGIVFQDYALFPHKTVLANIVYGLFRLNARQQEQKAAEVIRLTGLEGLEKRYPHQLSGGQKQRVALARALAPEPGIILFDEPFSNIDNINKTRIRRDIQRIIKASGSTAIFVTHDTQDVLDIADRVVVMHQGCCLQHGKPLAVCEKPCHPYVEGLFRQGNFSLPRN